jgi:hypothetical protein
MPLLCSSLEVPLYEVEWLRSSSRVVLLSTSDQRARASMRVREIGVFVSYVTATGKQHMASLRARNLFLLEKSALKFDLNGVERRNKHYILKAGIN